MVVVTACTKRVETTTVETAAPVNTPVPVQTPPAPVAGIRTDRTSYVLTNGPQGPEATIVATLRAPADQTLYILNCNGMSSATVQRKVGEAWVYAMVIASSACLSPPIVVPSGGEHTARISLNDFSAPVVDPDGTRRIVPGTYRVVWTGVLTSFDSNKPGFGPELPLEQRVSAPFTIEAPS